MYLKPIIVTGFNENKVGAEIFVNTGTGKQINLTLNPDFGQAESDEVIVNFSAQETFYSEKELSLMKTSLCLIYLVRQISSNKYQKN